MQLDDDPICRKRVVVVGFEPALARLVVEDFIGLPIIRVPDELPEIVPAGGLDRVAAAVVMASEPQTRILAAARDLGPGEPHILLVQHHVRTDRQPLLAHMRGKAREVRAGERIQNVGYGFLRGAS